MAARSTWTVGSARTTQDFSGGGVPETHPQGLPRRCQRDQDNGDRHASAVPVRADGSPHTAAAVRQGMKQVAAHGGGLDQAKTQFGAILDKAVLGMRARAHLVE
jgi:hypothetical protein